MPAISLRCRRCSAEHELVAVGVCSKCFAPLEPVYDRAAQRATISRASIQAGPLNIWRYADLLPVAAPANPRLAPGMTPLIAAPRLAAALGVGELFIKTDTANPTHSFKDRVVAVACAKAIELGMDTLACSSTGNLANAVAARAAAEGIEGVVFVPADLEPEKLLATAVYGATLYAVQGTPTPDYLDVHGYIALLTATIDQLQASRYSDGEGHADEKPAPTAESESGDDA